MVSYVDIQHKIGDIVYLKTDPEQRERIVTSIQLYQKDIIYCLSCSEDTTRHYDFEIAKEKDLVNT